MNLDENGVLICKTAKEFMQIPQTNPKRIAAGVYLPPAEFAKLPPEDKAMIFNERTFKNLPFEEYISIVSISKNLLNGCCWEFIRSNADIKAHLEDFKKNPKVSVQTVTYSHKANITGYLLYMQMQEACSILDERNGGLFNHSDITLALQHRELAKASLLNKLKKGYLGKIGIYCTNDSQTITIDGKSFPSYAVTLKELCAICINVGYGILVGGKPRNPNDVVAREDAVIANLTVAPSSNALLIEVAPMR